MKIAMSKMMPGLVFAVLLCVSASTVFAGQFNTVMEIGSTAPAWKDLPGTDGQDHSYESVADAKVVVVAFTCNSCPYAVDVEDRLIELVKRFDNQGVAFVAINVNTVEEDKMPAMKERAKEKGFTFPYLWDPSQQIAKDYGAKYTPEFFVLGKDRKLVYMGSFDDSPAGDKVTKRYVSDAIESALAGRTVKVTETVPIGCSIRFERQSRKRSR
jgi:peroxiredoxin